MTPTSLRTGCLIMSFGEPSTIASFCARKNVCRRQLHTEDAGADWMVYHTRAGAARPRLVVDEHWWSTTCSERATVHFQSARLLGYELPSAVQDH